MDSRVAGHVCWHESKAGPLIFSTGASLVRRTMADLWRNNIAKVFKLAARATSIDAATVSGILRPILLEIGVPVAMFAEWIGDTEEGSTEALPRWFPEAPSAG